MARTVYSTIHTGVVITEVDLECQSPDGKEKFFAEAVVYAQGVEGVHPTKARIEGARRNAVVFKTAVKPMSQEALNESAGLLLQALRAEAEFRRLKAMLMLKGIDVWR